LAVTLDEFLQERGTPREAAAIMAHVAPSTISRIINGQSEASPGMILRLARAFGVAPRRMRAMCPASWERAKAAAA